MVTAEAALEAVERALDGPRAVGRCDCVTAACDAFAEMFGIDPIATWRGRWSSDADAAAILAAEGGPVRLAVGAFLDAGLVRRAPADARPGDLALLNFVGSVILGNAIGGGMFATKAPDGMAFLHERRALGCWGLP